MSVLKTISIQVGSLGKFWQNKLNHQIFRWNIIFIIGQLAFLIFKFNSLPDQVPLYYSLPWGESQLASVPALFFLPTFSIIFLLINHLLATFFLNSIQLFSRLLIIISLIFSIFSFITLFQIITIIS
jgi:hypothetical protein